MHLWKLTPRPEYANLTVRRFLTPYQAQVWLDREYPAYAARYTVEACDWREREQALFAAEVYRQPVWSKESWWTANEDVWEDHFVHASLEDATAIAFTEDERKGEADRQTRIKPGRYLKRFFGDILTDKQIAFYAEWQAKGERPKLERDARFGIARTAAQICEAYVHGPVSCMDGRNFEDASDHPARVYATRDLGVAYLHSTTAPLSEDNGLHRPYIARALVRFDDNGEPAAYGRVYPTADRYACDGFESQEEAEEVRMALIEALRAEGFRSEAETGRGLEGARLRKIHLSGDSYVMPYLDQDYRVEDGGDCFIMSRHGDHDADNICGTITIEDNSTECDECGDRVEEDEGHTAFSTAHHNYGGDNLVTVCDHCYSHSTFRCEGHNETMLDRVPHTELNGETYSDVWLDQNAFTCARTGELTLDRDGQTLENGERWSDDAVERFAFTCEHDGGVYPLEEESRVYPGYAARYDRETLPDREPVAEEFWPVEVHPDQAPLPLELEAA